MTRQSVFGSNHFKDLTPEEFKEQYLTGYKGPRTDELEKLRVKKQSQKVRQLGKQSGHVLDPRKRKPKMHSTVKQRVLQQREEGVMKVSNPKCGWYEIPCWLRWIFYNVGIEFGFDIGTMEPMYDANNYPNAVDWRESGAVTSVHSQSECGACWAIAAVETIESVHFMSTGKLYDLSEAEIIVCDETCDMCNGGWPQNAYEYVMENGGIPLEQSMTYNANFLYSLTQALEGTSDTLE